MNVFKIAWRSIQQRALSSSLTAFSMALGVALVVAVLVIYGVVLRSFSKGAEGFDMIVGAKGGKLQLVLNTVYHLSTPIENVPWHYYKEFRPGGRYAKQVSVAIPYCLGDNYQGYRVVGTLPELFEVEYAQDEHYKFIEGRNFEEDHFFEAVVGYLVSKNTGLKAGDEFEPTHGVTEGQGHKHDSFKVVGVLGPTGTPNDRAVFVNMEGFFLLDGHAKPLPAGGAIKPAHDHKAGEKEHKHDEKEAKPAAPKGPAAKHDHAAHKHDHAHEHDHHEPLPEDQREVTAILVRTASPLVNVSLPRLINKEPYAQAVFAAKEIQTLFATIVGNIQKLLLFLAVLVVIVSGIGIMVSIYNSMSERRREIAIMRALGASREKIMLIILLESILLSLGGGIAGLLLGHATIGVLSPLIVAQTGVSVGMFQFEYWREITLDFGQISAALGVVRLKVYWELILIPGLIVLASLVGFIPALSAYRTDVSKALVSGG